MKRIATLLTVCVMMTATTWCLSNTLAQPQAPSQIQALSSVAAIQPGKPFTVALKMTMEDGWHSYWVNAGDAGFPLSVDWTLPAGFTVGEFHWPVPKRLEAEGTISFIYEKEATVLVDITPPKTLQAGSTVKLVGKASWLVCKAECIPASGNVALSLPVQAEEQPNPKTAPIFQRAQENTAAALPTGWTTAFARTGSNYVLTLTAPEGTVIPNEGWSFLPESTELAYNKPAVFVVKANVLSVTIPATDDGKKPVTKLRGILLAPEKTEVVPKWTAIQALKP